MYTFRVDTTNYWALVSGKSVEQVKAYYLKYFADKVEVRRATAGDVSENQALGLRTQVLSPEWDHNDEGTDYQDQRLREINSGLS